MARSSGHVVVCGLSNLGVRVAEQLIASGVLVVVVDDQDASGGARRRLERHGVRVVHDSPHSSEALLEADIDTAVALAACDDVDLDNLQTALAAAEAAPSTRLVVSIGNAQLGDQLAAAIPTAHVINMGTRVGPSFVEACIRSDVVHAFTMDAHLDPHSDTDVSEVFAVVDAVVDEAEAFRARYGDLTPVALRRPGVPGAVLCPPRDVPLAQGDHLTVLGRLAEFDARGMTVAGLQDARTFAALAAHAAASDGGAARTSAARWRGGPDAEGGLRQEGVGQGLAGRARALTRTVREEFDRPFRWALGAMLTIVVVSTVVLRLFYAANDPAAPRNFSVLDALYMTVETMTTVGYGDFNFSRADHWLQIFGICLMLVGALSIAVIYAFITNVIISRRLARALGRGRAGAVRGHVVICGLGKVGTATMEGLLRAGRRVVVIERNENNRFLSVARERGVPVVVGDATVRETLMQAGIGHATAIAALTSDGVANLETVLSARDAHEEFCQTRGGSVVARGADRRRGGQDVPSEDGGLRVVLRIAEVTLTAEVERRFDIHTVRSAAALASPYFVGAALGYDVISTFYVERTPFLVARMVVRPGAALVGPTLAELATGARVLAVTAAPGEPAAGVTANGTAGLASGKVPAQPTSRDGGEGGPGSRADAAPPAGGAARARPNFRPGRYTRLRPGDELLVVGPVTEIVAMIRRNQRPTAAGTGPVGSDVAPAAVVGAESDPRDD
jgi:Trk K+ transport system NAD-binding subunit